jgi:hypothetical protein
MLVLSAGAVMAAMLVMSAVPAFAQNAPQTSGAAMSDLLVNAEKAGNVAVQQANNVNTGNNQQNLLNLQSNAQINANVLVDSSQAIAAGGDVNIASNNTATQSNTATNTQNGITQVNMAQQSVAQALAIVR